MKYLMLLLLISGCTTTNSPPPIFICYAYAEPGIIAWGDSSLQAEQTMQQVNCELKPSTDCANRKCDKVEIL